MGKKSFAVILILIVTTCICLSVFAVVKVKMISIFESENLNLKNKVQKLTKQLDLKTKENDDNILKNNVLKAEYDNLIKDSSKKIDGEIVSNKYFINSSEKFLSESQNGFIYKNKLYLPCDFIAESLNEYFFWDKENYNVYIGSTLTCSKRDKLWSFLGNAL